ncbi:MAG: outer membrane beta-barrel protein [Proteobacteria bacterium]|nr:outer membrane beta-barrel protein [Pseudomonadota bacterium]MBU4053963.1 outer membrane beta-barrel protein [Pseudomonadota bacterium]
MMKKSHWMILFVCLSLLLAGSASAGMYVGVKGGLSVVKDIEIRIPGEEIVYLDATLADMAPPTEDYAGELGFDTGYLVGVSVGSTIMDTFRVEGEFEYRNSDVQATGLEGEDTLKTMALMVNGYYDFKTDSALTPYVGAGIGYARHDVDDLNVDDTVFAYQGSLGVAWTLCETMDLDLGYRYFVTADPDLDKDGLLVDGDYGSHNFTVGIRFKL